MESSITAARSDDGVPVDGGLVLHVGAPKSATTAIQSCLAASRDALGRAGVLYPGSTLDEIPGVHDPIGWPDRPDDARRSAQRWQALLDEVSSYRGQVVVSAETLAAAGAERIDTILAGFDRDDVRVVVTLRSLAQIIPSEYQQRVKAGVTATYRAWTDEILAGPDPAHPAATAFWAAHDHAALVARWVGAVGADRVTVVVLDPTDRNMVFRAFEQVMGLQPGFLRAELATRQNRSMTSAECEMVRRFNERRVAAGRSPESWSIRGEPIARLLDHRVPPASEPRLTLPVDAVDAVRSASAAAIERLAVIGPRVVGNLDWLDPEPAAVAPSAVAPSGGVRADDHPDIVSIEAAAALIHGVFLEAIGPAAAQGRSNDDRSG